MESEWKKCEPKSGAPIQIPEIDSVLRAGYQTNVSLCILFVCNKDLDQTGQMPNNSVVYGQKHKVWILIFLVRTSGTF